MNNHVLDILKVMFLAILLWFVITAWDDVIDRVLFSILKINEKSIWSWVLVAIIHTIIALSIFLWLDVDIIETLGIHFRRENACNKCNKEFRINE
jgi:hypothetical protein